MKKTLLLSLFAFLLISCGSTKNTKKIPNITAEKTEAKTHHDKKENPSSNRKEVAKKETEENGDSKDIRENIIEYAKTFQGTRYKYGGTTKAGVDCSGLVYKAFQKEYITLPRVSRDMAKKGVLVSFKDIEKGDLIFFKTSRKYNINHVGLIVESKHGKIKFIHSTTHGGVIISSLDEAYWKKAFVEVRRVI